MNPEREERETNLMGTDNQINSEDFAGGCHNSLSKCVRDSARGVEPAVALVGGVGPQQVDEHAAILRFTRTWDGSDLIEMCEFGTEATVHAEDFLGDQAGHGHSIEDGLKFPPKSDPGIHGFIDAL